MKSLKNSPYYCEALHELEYDFGTFFLFENFIVGEVKSGMTLNWEDHSKKVTKDILDLYDSNGENIIYISNRINDYSIVPSDWIKFYRSNYKLKGYGVINHTKNGHVIYLLEKLFINSSSKRFNSLEQAINWAKSLSKVPHMAYNS